MADTNRQDADVLCLLRQKIQHIQGFRSEIHESPVMLGVPALDNAFPGQCFPTSAVHEFAYPRKKAAPVLGFISAAISLIAGTDGPILWITKARDVFPPGLTLFGLQPHRIVFMAVRNDKEALWAMEEGLRCKGISVAITEVAEADLTATRRLQLAVEKSGVTGFLLRSKVSGSSSCFSSWQVEALPSELEDGLPGVGHPRWRVELRKIRNGQPGVWDLEWRGGALHEVVHHNLEKGRGNVSLSGVA